MFNKGSGRSWEMDVLIFTAMHIGKDIFNAIHNVMYHAAYRLNLVLVDTAKGIKEVRDADQLKW